MAEIQDKILSEPVARHMHRDYVTLRLDQSVGEALEWLRKQTLSDKVLYFYVVDADGVLVGVVPTRRLLMSQLDTPISNIMIARVVSIPSHVTVLEACEFFLMHRLLAFPVVDHDEKLVGVVDVSLFTREMVDVSQKRSANDVFQLIGIHVEHRHRSAWAGFKDRFPWLLCNIAGGIGCAFIANHFDSKLHNHMLILALFIPVVLTLSEGVSIQSMTITLQSLREGKVDWKMFFGAMRLELLTAAMLGAGSGLLVAIVAGLWKRDPITAAAIGVSITLAIITACALGVVLPIVVRALRGDPRIAAGPVVLASADVATLLFYFSLANIVLKG